MSKPGAHTDLTEGEAADALFAILSPELYLLLTRDRAWSPERWSEWACTTLHAQLIQQ